MGTSSGAYAYITSAPVPHILDKDRISYHIILTGFISSTSLTRH